MWTDQRNSNNCKITYKHWKNSKITIFYWIIIYVLYTIKKLKYQKNNYYKCICHKSRQI